MKQSFTNVANWPKQTHTGAAHSWKISGQRKPVMKRLQNNSELYGNSLQPNAPNGTRRSKFKSKQQYFVFIDLTTFKMRSAYISKVKHFRHCQGPIFVETACRPVRQTAREDLKSKIKHIYMNTKLNKIHNIRSAILLEIQCMNDSKTVFSPTTVSVQSLSHFEMNIQHGKALKVGAVILKCRVAYNKP